MNELDQLLKDLSVNPSRVTSLARNTDSIAGSIAGTSMFSETTIKAPHNNNYDREPSMYSTTSPMFSPPSVISNSTSNLKIAIEPRSDAHNDLEKLVTAVPPSTRSSAIPPLPNSNAGKAYQICATCNQQIADPGQLVTALGQTFHSEHFKCNNCSKLLVGSVFFEKDHKPFCEKCMNETYLLPTCAYCGENIKGRCINALEKNWHPDHFFCSQCGRQFPPGAPFLERDGKAYCEEDYYNMFSPKCATCDQPINDEVVTALGKSFHADCFKCSEPGCKVLLSESGSFFEHNSKPYCEIHYHSVRGSLCASCLKPITGRCLTAIGKRFHPEHFVCAFCKRQLGSGSTTTGSQATFKDRDGKPYCTTCYVKLYG